MLVAWQAPAHKRVMPDLFDMRLRAMRRDRAARSGVELFLYERAFADCLERLALLQRTFEHALLIGCPDPAWPARLEGFARRVEVRDPGPIFAERSSGEPLTEDAWHPPEAAYDLMIAVGTLDTANDLSLALRLIRHSMRSDALLLAAFSGRDTLPLLRNAMRAADAMGGGAAPHVHPRIEATAVAPLLEAAGFVNPVVDVDRVGVSYVSLDRLIADLRAMGTTNILQARPRFVGRTAKAAADRVFSATGDGSRTVETFEILHFAAWTASKG
jgi:NADH dehydrogenase [ubiquinone] 1 alpha subcomplex assembly factor 5